MVNELLVDLVNNILGIGKRTSKGNMSYTCPMCNHHKPKLEINFTENKEGNNPWHCWVCDEKGKKLRSLFKKIKSPPEHFAQLNSLVRTGSHVIEVEYESQVLALPKEFKSLLNDTSLIARHVIVYLNKRGISREDIIKYNIGYCDYGPYNNRIILPSYDKDNNLNYFTSRAFKEDMFPPYKNPDVSRDIVPFESQVNWKLPIILCEGPFDSIAIKRNSIPLLGKNIQQALLKKLISSEVKEIYIALDKDAIKSSLRHCEKFIDEGKEVYLIELPGKDPSEMGFKEFTKLVHKSVPLNQFNFLRKKISLL